MAEEFKAIETQDELNAIIKARLDREREASNKRYEGYISPEEHNKALADANKTLEELKAKGETDAATIAELTAKNSAYEVSNLKNRIAREVGLGYEWVDRIGGTDEESIRKDAESLKKLVGNNSLLPTKTPTGANTDPKRESLKAVLSGVKTE